MLHVTQSSSWIEGPLREKFPLARGNLWVGTLEDDRVVKIVEYPGEVTPLGI